MGADGASGVWAVKLAGGTIVAQDLATSHPGGEPDADVRKMMSRVGPAMKSGCIGRPDQVREQLMRYADMGIELFLLKFVPTVDEVHAIRDEIIAPLRANAQKATAAE